MKYNSLQLMIYGINLSNLDVWCDSDFIIVNSIQTTNNGSYAFINISLSQYIPADNYFFYATNESDTSKFIFPVLEREKNENSFRGFNTSDIIYLITPDRFANGDTANDNVEGMIEGYDPSPRGRHGGDIQGIIDKLDYLSDLGITAIWINPLVENNGNLSYHGYAATDLYRIDPRFGSNDLYKKLVDKSHARGIKIILDNVNNHVGINHPWVKELPFEDWFNKGEVNYFITPHQKISLYDSNSPRRVADSTMNGWFVDEMPDLNQKNPFVAEYLIQRTLWWIEFSGIDGIREDTYPYSDQKFLSEWAQTILEEYPDFNIVGEVWIEDAAFLAPYQSKNILHQDFDTHLPTITDFGFLRAVWKTFNENESINRIYQTLAKDFLFTDPSKLLIFLDNHDIERIMYLVKGDRIRFKLALKLLLTMRGIPQILYGTEIGLLGDKGHGELRANFPGGFPDDERNAFTESGRTGEENELFNFVKKLIQIKKDHKALSMGQLIHFPPVNEVYIYFRLYENENVMILLNNSNEEQNVDLNPLSYMLSGNNYLINLETEEETEISSNKKIIVEANSGYIYLLKE